MPTDDQVVRVDFTQGLDTRSDERLVVPGKLLAAQNVTLSKDNALTRCDGYSSLCTISSGSTTSATPNGLAVLGNELLATVGPDLETIATNGSVLPKSGTVSPVTLSKTEIFSAIASMDMLDSAATGTYTCYVWRDFKADQSTVVGLKCLVFEEATGAVALELTSFGTATAVSPRVVAIPAAVTGASNIACFIIVWADGANLNSAFVDLSGTSPVFTAGPTLQTDYNAGANCDAMADQGNALVLYPSTDATNSAWALHVKCNGITLTTATKLAVATQANYPVANVTALAVGQVSSGVWGACVLVSAGVGRAGMNSAILSTTATALTIGTAIALKDATAAPLAATADNRITAVATSNGGTRLAIYSDQATSMSAAAGQVPIRKTLIDGTNAVVSGPSTLIESNTFPFASGGPNGPFIAAKAVNFMGRSWLPVYIASGQQSSFFLLGENSITSLPAIAATALQGTYGIFSQTRADGNFGSAPSCPTLSDGSLSVPVPERGILSFDPTVFGGSLNVTPIGLARLKLTPMTATPQMRAQLGRVLFFAGGVLTQYDGHCVSEAGFLVYPEGVTLTRVVGGGTMAGGTYQVSVMYEVVDGQGQRHQSAPSPAVSINTIVANDRLDVTVPTLILSMHAGTVGITGVNIVIACTKAGGGTFYRVNAQNDPLYNNPTAATVTYRISAEPGSGELLYTTGGVLPNVAPPPCSIIEAHQDRLFMAGLEDSRKVEFSQPQVDGFGLQFSDELIGSGEVSQESGGVTGLKSIDEKLVVFTRRRPYIISGNGPSTTGDGNGYLGPDELASDVGCTEPRSVLKTEKGVVFKGAKGWHLLDRGLNVRYIGDGVEAYNANDVKAAVLLDDRKEARFYSSSGRPLVWSTLVEQWTTEFAFNLGAVDAVWWPASASVVRVRPTSGIIYKDAAGSYGFDGSAETVIIDTGWLHLSQALQGFQRAKRLLLTGPYLGQSSLTIKQYVDYDSTAVNTITVSDTSTLASAAGTTWAFRWHLPQQKCSAMRFEIVDTPASASSGGLNFSSMSLLVGLKKGAAKLKAALSG